MSNRFLLSSVRPRFLGAIALLVGAVVLLYLQVRTHDFIIFDDPLYIHGNSYSVEGLNWENIVWAFSNLDAANWHPLTWLSHMLDCQIFGAAPGPHQLVNAGFHALNTVLLFWLVERITGRSGAALFVAMVFAVHPLNVETVAWASQRKSLLNMALLLLALHAYVDFSRRPSFRNYGFCLIAFELSLLAKSMSVTLPVVLILLDFWPLGRMRFQGARDGGSGRNLFGLRLALPENWRRLVFEKIPFLAIALWLGLLTVYAQASIGAAPDLEYLSVSGRLLNTLASYGAYVGKAIIPLNLGVFYPMRDFANWSKYLPDWALALGLVVIAARAIWRRSPVAVGLLWFGVTLLPVCGLLQVGAQAMADRYFYLPGIGLSLALVAWNPTAGLSGQLRRVVHWGALPMYCAFLGVFTYAQIMLWKSGTLLFVSTMENCGPSPGMVVNLSATYITHGMLDDALKTGVEGLRIFPGDSGIAQNLAIGLLGKGRTEEGYRILKDLEAVRFSRINVALGLAVAHYRLGDPKRAMYYIKFCRLLLPREKTWDVNVERVKRVLNDPNFNLKNFVPPLPPSTATSTAAPAPVQLLVPAR